MQLIESSADKPFTDNIPMDILLDLPQRASDNIRKVLLRHFCTTGQKLARAYHRSHPGCEMFLNGCEKLLDRNFSTIDLRTRGGDEVLRYLEPIYALLDGIADECLLSSEDRSCTGGRAFRDAVNCVLQMTVKAQVYSTISEEPAFWLEVHEAQRDKGLLSSKNLSSCLKRYGNFLVRSVDASPSPTAFEAELRVNTAVKSDLYRSLARALGEAIHRCHIATLIKSKTPQQSVNIALEKALEILSEKGVLHMSECTSSYMKATFDSVLDHLRNNQYLVPRSLALLPPWLHAVKERHSADRLVCGPDFIPSLEKYSGLFEDRILVVLLAFDSRNVSKKEVRLVTDASCVLDSFNVVAAAWDMDGGGLKVLPLALFVAAPLIFLIN